MFTAGKSVSDFLPIDNLLAKSTSATAGQQLGIEMSKTASLASDGASVMMGETGGLAAKLRDKHCPMLLNIHCVRHRLATCLHTLCGRHCSG